MERNIFGQLFAALHGNSSFPSPVLFIPAIRRSGLLPMTHPARRLGPLFRLALRSGAVDAIVLHLARGESVNGRDAAGLTPLMIAAIHNHHACCERLISLGADSHLRSIGGKTAAELAADHGHLTIASMLAPCAAGSEAFPRASTTLIETEYGDFVPPDIIDSKIFRESDGNSSGAPSDNPESMVFDRTLSSPIQDLNGWVADESDRAPAHEAWITDAAQEIHRRISTHRRVDDASDWSAIEFDLPDVRAVSAVLSHADLPAVAALLSAGLTNGYLTQVELYRAVDADCGETFERALEIVRRILDDLGILLAPHIGIDAQPSADDFSDMAAEALELLRDQLSGPADPLHLYLAEAHKFDLIRREDEERIGRHIDGALGVLVRTLASLSETDWLLLVSRNPPAKSVVEDIAIEDALEEVTPTEPSEDFGASDSARLDFQNHVKSLRDGGTELGRDAPVPRPSAAERSELIELTRHLDDAAGAIIASSIAAYETSLERLVKANLRLAVSLSHNYRYSGVQLDDLVQEANIGLMRAAERFDFRLGNKFSTYATWWIRQGIGRSVQDTHRDAPWSRTFVMNFWRRCSTR